jgi:FtsZ-binding cell division protein ZapB
MSDCESRLNTSQIPVKAEDKITKTINENLIAIFKQIERKNIERNQQLIELISLSNLESTLAEQMIKNKYYQSGKSSAAYEQMRKTIIQTIAEDTSRLSSAKIMQLEETIQSLQGEIDVLRKEVDKANQQNGNLQNTCVELREDYNKAQETAKKYKELIIWYETLVREVPGIRKKNSKFIFGQSWEETLSEYMRLYPKPKV